MTTLSTAFPLSLGNYHVPLRSMQATLRTLLQESMDRYRIEQESMLVPGHQTGVHTPTGSNTPSQMTIAIPNTTTHSIPTLLLSQPSFSTLLSSLTDDDCPFVQLPVFTEALRYTQASIFTCDDTSKMTNTLSFNGVRTTRNDLSLTLTSARILGALHMLTDSNTRLSIRPKEIAETVQLGMESVSQRLQQGEWALSFFLVWALGACIGLIQPPLQPFKYVNGMTSSNVCSCVESGATRSVEKSLFFPLPF